MFKLDTVRFPLPDQVHLYKGIIYQSNSTPEVLDKLHTADIREGDWMVATYPKSGTTWMQEILYLIGTDGDTTEADKTPLARRTAFLETTQWLPHLSDLPTPRVIKTHLTVDMIPQQVWDQNVKIVHVIRNPKDVAVSYYHFSRAAEMLGNFSGTWALFYDMFITGNVACGSWFTFIKDWYDQCRKNKNVYFITYEQIKRKPRAAIEGIARFLGKDISENTLDIIVKRTAFQMMKENKNTNFSHNPAFNFKVSPFIRKGEVGDWKNYFTVAQNELFDEIYEKETKGYLDVLDF